MNSSQQIKVNSKIQYITFQLFGWGFFILLLGILNSDDGGGSMYLIGFLGSVFIINLFLSHFYRLLVIKFNWMSKPIVVILIRTVLASLILGGLFMLTANISRNLIIKSGDPLFTSDALILGILIYFIWSILYFVYLLFYKARREEFKNIQLQVLNSEVELKNLRSQLNPHFMFNAMNSIRALVDENPDKSKKAITQLSNVLRNSLIHSKQKKVRLEEEMNIVKDYLSLEKIRYEERLSISIEIEENTRKMNVPPLLIQTLVENGIKHGISKLMKGGEIRLKSFEKDNELVIEIINSGTLNEINKTETGIGIKNTRKRLNLLYGNKARFSLNQVSDKVKATIGIPLNQEE